MKPLEAWEYLVTEIEIPEDEIPRDVVELLATAWEYKAAELVETGVWPETIDELMG